MGRQWP